MISFQIQIPALCLEPYEPVYLKYLVYVSDDKYDVSFAWIF